MRYALKALVITLGVSMGLSAGSALARNNFGAIAISASTTRYGIAVNRPTRPTAEAAALRACGVSDCTIRSWFANSCGALAINQAGNRIGYSTRGATRTEAERAALRAVGRNGRVVAWGCAK